MGILAEILDSGDVELLRAAIAEGEDVNERVDEQTLLDAAVQMDNIDMVRILLEAGADPNATSFDDEAPPIFWAVQADRMEILELLREHGARLDVHPHRDSVLHVAASRGNLGMLKYLLDTEARSALEIFDYVGRTPLVCAMDEGDLACVLALLEANADVNAVGGDDHPTCRTPLQHAIGDGKVEIVRALLQRGADPVLTACGMVEAPIELARKRKKIPDLLELVENALGSGGQHRRKKRPTRR